jgi:hypothetical protein
MKILLVSAVLAAASLSAPAFAQQAVQQVTPDGKAKVTVETDVQRTPGAVVETRTETIAPIVDAAKAQSNVTPELTAVITSGRKYSATDIATAQLEALRNSGSVQKTTTITTTTTTPTG